MTIRSLSKRRRTAAAIVSAAAVATIGFQSLGSEFGRRIIAGHDEVDELEEASRRQLYTLKLTKKGDEYIPESDQEYDTLAAEAAATFQDDEPFQTNYTIQPYTLEDALAEASIFEYTFTTIIYDPPSDTFLGLYSKDHKWKNGNRKLWKAMRQLVYMLRTLFPERFNPNQPELVLAMGSGDYPHVRKAKLPRTRGVAPVLMFGSSFANAESTYSNMIPMPMPVHQHMGCFVEWVQSNENQVCKYMKGDDRKFDEFGTLIFGEEYGLEWENLIPQLIWRGTDFSYLPTLQDRPSLVHPDWHQFVRSPNQRYEAIKALNDKYDNLLPRWKGAALTAMAEMDAELQQKEDGQDHLPWADIKLSSHLEGKKSDTVGSRKYAPWESVGIGVANGMPGSQLATYKYHIDLGGGGGTTWSGTTEKLAMPGLLFHHVTPTKDYFHDHLKPWKHYIPVRADLKDLKSKYDWAESHPIEAKRIADAGTAFMRRLGNNEGFRELFQADFVEPMRRIIEAYQPVAAVHKGDKYSWREVLRSMGKDCRQMPVMECTGLSPETSCDLVGGDAIKAWANGGLMYAGKDTQFDAAGAATDVVE